MAPTLDSTRPQIDTTLSKTSGQVPNDKNSSGTPKAETFHELQQDPLKNTDTQEKGIEASAPSNTSLLVDKPTSASAFPSPSSSFIPPPTLDEREFAIKPTPRQQSAQTNSEIPAPIVLPPPEAVNESSIFDNAVPKPSLFNTSDSSSSKLDVNATPRRTNDARTPRLSTSALQPSPLIPVFSLPTSSRPAPQSPVASRRTSRAISVNSSTSNSSPRLKPQHPGRDSFQARPARMSSLSISTLPPGAKVSIKIIDFAFDIEDERRLGFGEHVPKCNRPARMNRRLTLSDQSSGAETETDEEDDEEEVEGDGWGGFSWGRLSSSFPAAGYSDEPVPSQGELDANFDQDSDDEEYQSAEDTQGDGLYDGKPAYLYPGLYRALYAFEPEGTSEMRLEPEQLVKVLGRGGGEGWAIAVREDGQHALVPEDYLELVRLDGEDEDY